MRELISEAHHIDCMEYMANIPDKYFDLAIPDPNYGIGASRPTKKNKRILQDNGNYLDVKQADYKHKAWDDKPADKEYFDELIRVSKNQIIWGVNYYDYIFGPGRIVWNKVNGESDQMDCEIAYCSFNDRIEIVHYMWAGMMQGIYCGKDMKKALVQQGDKTKNEKRRHPTQKPVILYRYLFKKYLIGGGKVYDSHFGSGNSRIAAHMEGLDYYGNEIDEEIFNDAEMAYNEYKKQLSFF